VAQKGERHDLPTLDAPQRVPALVLTRGAVHHAVPVPELPALAGSILERDESVVALQLLGEIQAGHGRGVQRLSALLQVRAERRRDKVRWGRRWGRQRVQVVIQLGMGG
jgi:hypothetical protein